MYVTISEFKDRKLTEDKGDGDLLCIFITVYGKFLEQPLLIFREDEPGGWRTQTYRGT